VIFVEQNAMEQGGAMRMEQNWGATKFGAGPLHEVKIVVFEFSGGKGRDDVAFAQYNLLLSENVLQAHLEPESKQGKVVSTVSFNLPEAMQKLGLSCSVVSEKTVSYETLLSMNNKQLE